MRNWIFRSLHHADWIQRRSLMLRSLGVEEFAAYRQATNEYNEKFGSEPETDDLEEGEDE